MTIKTRFTLALATMTIWAGMAAAQPPGRPPPPGGVPPPGGPPGRFGGPRGPDLAQRALDKLQLTGKAEQKAQDVLDEHNAATRRMLDKDRRELLSQVKAVVSDEQYLVFKDAVNTPPGPRAISATDLVEHVMSYDKKNLGKVCKDDLPERMQHLIAKGDTNKDGYLDREELKLLALKLGPAARGPGRPFLPPDADRALTRLQLTGEPQEKVRKSVDVFKTAAKKLGDERRADLIDKMKGVLTEEQHQRFRESLQASVSATPGDQ